jgi:hypothetical protein
MKSFDVNIGDVLCDLGRAKRVAIYFINGKTDTHLITNRFKDGYFEYQEIPFEKWDDRYYMFNDYKAIDWYNYEGRRKIFYNCFISIFKDLE